MSVRLIHKVWMLLSVVLAPAILFGQATAPAKQAPAQPAKAPLAAITDTPGLPRVLLIGDSISIGYTLAVRQELEGVANVHRIPENGGPTTRGIEKLDAWLGKDRWDVIHFNWGLHDLKRLQPNRCQVPLDEYEANLCRLVARLKQTGAALVWATTTPVPKGAQQRDPLDVPRYSEVALRIMRENGIAVNDLHAFAAPRLAEIQRPKDVHFTSDGYAALAARVEQSIRKALQQRRATSTAPASGRSASTKPQGRTKASPQPVRPAAVR